MRGRAAIFRQFSGAPLRVWKFIANQASEAVGSVLPIALICTVEKIETATVQLESLCNESSGCFGGDSLDKSVKAIEDCAKLCCIGLKIVLSRITALQFSLIFLNRIRLQAHVHLGQVEILVKALSGNWIHSNGDAGLHRPRQIMVGYL